MADHLFSSSLRLANDPGECGRLYEFLDGCMDRISADDEFRHDLKLVSEELFANIIIHGFSKDMAAEIELEFTATGDRVFLVYRDTGIEFNPLAKSPDTESRDLSEGGMGITLVKSLTDNQSYARLDNRNVLTVTKHYNQRNE